MRRLYLAFLGFAAAQAASAADLPARAPIYNAPPVAAEPIWTGFYVDGGVGYGAWAADTTTINGIPSLSTTQTQGGKGWLGRIGGGFDYQFTLGALERLGISNFVVGLFGSYDFSNLRGTIQDQTPLFAGNINQTGSWAAGARAGWLLTPAVLGYWNLGFTSARFSSANMVNTVTGGATAFSTPAFNANGWFLGGGTEASIAPNWFWRLEYRYASYGNETVPDNGPGPQAGIKFKPQVQTATTELIYKFNPGIAAPSYSAPAAVAPTTWTGFNVYGGVGYGIWSADTATVNRVPSLPVTQTQGGKGWLGRIGGGFDYQFTSNIVAGLFGDYDISSLRGTIQDQIPFFAGDIKQTGSWAIGGRAGWLVTPALLAYANVGYTGARFSSANMVSTVTGGATPFSTQAFSANGWFVGGGVEKAVAVAPGWFWRSEYRYASYDTRTLPDMGPALQASIMFKPVVQTVTTEVVYKFNVNR